MASANTNKDKELNLPPWGHPVCQKDRFFDHRPVQRVQQGVREVGIFLWEKAPWQELAFAPRQRTVAFFLECNYLQYNPA